MKRIFRILCAFAVIVSGLSPAIAAERPEIFVQMGHTEAVYSAAFSPDGKFALSGGSSDNTLRLWEISTGREVRTFMGHKYGVTSVAFSPDGSYTGSKQGPEIFVQLGHSE